MQLAAARAIVKKNVDKYIFEMVASFSLCHELLQMELFSQQDWCQYFS